MVGEIFGADGLFILVFLLLGIATLAIPIWALVDAGTKPSAAFDAAGSSKVLWIVLIAALWVFTGIVGLIVAIVYLASVRPRVQAIVQERGPGGFTAGPRPTAGPPVAGSAGWWQASDGRWYPPNDGNTYGATQYTPAAEPTFATQAPRTAPPAGWYTDPTTSKQRWWDGVQWGPIAPG